MLNIILIVGLTYIIYRFSKHAYKKWAFPLFQPLLLSPIVLILLLSLIDISPDKYQTSSKWLTHMLGPATVAFAIPIYKHFHLLRKYLVTIIISISIGTLVAILTSFALSIFIHLNSKFLISILPRSITTPIAIEVSKEIGGLPTLTTVFVILTGIIGGIIGPFIIKRLEIHSPIAKGLALGMGAHGVGTNKALEFGEQEATFSTLAMIFAAWITLFWGFSLIPLLLNIVHF